jgi:tetratricopeptide (TPR) repeat protein
MRIRSLLLWAALAVPGVGFAQEGPGASYLTTTPLQSPAGEPALGTQHRAAVKQAIQASLAGNHEAAIPVLTEAVRYCDAQQQVPGRKALSFQSHRQYALYMDGPGRGTPTEWLDMACANAYTHLGYIEIERGDIDAALRWLDKAIAVAPYDVEPLCEKGAALTRRKDWQGSKASYDRALMLARSQPENRHMEALALRGVGFAHIELGELENARASYIASQKLDPDSPTAKQELAYIEQLQQEQRR